MQNAFFLGANSKHGFYSLYDDLIDLEEASTVYIIKGSPGCGKSSFMRKIKEHAEKNGFDTEQIFCSSDPSSLDALIIPKLKTALVDGTAPHIVEPKYPIAVECYINLGEFADHTAISDKKAEIIDITRRYRAFFPRVYTLTNAAGALESELLDIALGGIDISRLHRKAHNIISRELRGHGSGGSPKRRFLSSISPAGCPTLFDTVPYHANNIYMLEDNFGLSMFLLSKIADAATGAGFDTYICYSPLTPERIEHIIIPEKALAFVTDKKTAPYNGDYSHKIRVDAMLDTTHMRDKKRAINFIRKLKNSTITEAVSTLHNAKKIHDEIEALYNPYIDFDSIYSLAEKTANKILNKSQYQSS